MRSLPTAVETALNTGRFEIAHLLTFHCLDGSGDPALFAFHDGMDPSIAFDVLEADGGTASRTFAGNGALLGVGNVTRSADGTVRTFSCELSGASASVDDMVRGHRLRGRPAEYHRLFLDPDTLKPLAAAVLWFQGFANSASAQDEAASGQGFGEAVYRIEMVSHLRRLTVENPGTKSDAWWRERRTIPGVGPDRIYRYSFKPWPVPWGELRPGQKPPAKVKRK